MKKIFILCAVVGYALFAHADDDSALLKKAAAGNLKALNQAFVLNSKSDGSKSEDIDIAIGKSIDHHPKNFLMALKKNKSIVTNLGSTLGNLGPDFVDDDQKQKGEFKKRLSAIQSVKDKSLKDVREECEAKLKRKIGN